MAEFDAERRKLVFRQCQTREELHDWVWVFLDLDLPGTIVDPDSNTTPLDMVWDCYSHFVHGSPHNRRLYYSARDAGKTLSESVLEVLVLVHLHLNIVHLAAIEEQSINAQRYLKDFLSKPDFRAFSGEDNTRTTEVIVYRPTPDDGRPPLTEEEWGDLKSGQERYTRFVSRAQIVVATMASVNGKHASLLCVDGGTRVNVRSGGVGRQRRQATARGIFRVLAGESAGGRSGGETYRELNLGFGDPSVEFQALDFNTGSFSFARPVRAVRSKQDTVRVVTDGSWIRSGSVRVSDAHKHRRSATGKRELVVSLPHPLFVVGRGFVQAQEIGVGDRVVIVGKTRDGGATESRLPAERAAAVSQSEDEWEQVLLGSLLGDCGIYFKGASLPWLSENHCPEQRAYMDWKRAILSRKVQTYDHNTAVSGYTGRPMVGYSSRASLALVPYKRTRSHFELTEHLGALGLAVWYMDDGCSGNGFRLSTEGVDEAQNCRLADLLWRNFQIRVEPHSYSRDRKTYWYLSGGVEAKRRLSEICAPHIHPDMAYKFDFSGNRAECRWCGREFWYYERGKSCVDCGDVVCRMIQQGRLGVEVVEEVTPAGERWVYDFTLESGHNYVTNGLVSHNCLDEIDVMKNPTVYKEAVNIPTVVKRNGRAILPLTVLTSTRKTSFGMVQEEINHAAETDLVVRHFNILDVTERCPTERHRPDLPRLPIYRSNETLKAIDTKAFDGLSAREQKDFIKDEGWSGCLSNCKMFAACKGFLASNQTGESEFLKPVQHVQQQLRSNTRDMAKAQMLCWKPSSTGLIYPSLEARRHVISPARAYEKVFGELPPPNLGGIEMTKAALVEALWEVDLDWWAGIDFGDSHNFVCALGFKFGRRGFVMRCKSAARLETPQQIEFVEPLKIFSPKVWCDTSSPGSIRQFHANGWRTQEWVKKPGSVADGIAAIQTMLSPVMADEPDLYFVRDTEDDPEIDLLIRRMQQYHYKLDAGGRPTGEPDKTDDDECDGIRYGVMNAFPILTNRAAGTVEVVSEQISAPPKGARYDQNNWVKQAISEATGKAWDGPVSWGEAFKNPDGTPFFGGEKKGPKQQRGRLIVDVD